MSKTGFCKQDGFMASWLHDRGYLTKHPTEHNKKYVQLCVHSQKNWNYKHHQLVNNRDTLEKALNV